MEQNQGGLQWDHSDCECVAVVLNISLFGELNSVLSWKPKNHLSFPNMVNIKVKNTKYYLKSLKYHQPSRAWSASKHCKNLRQAQRFRRHCSTLYKSKLMHLKNIHEQDKWCWRRLSGFNPKDSSPARPSVPHWPPTFYTITFLCMVST